MTSLVTRCPACSTLFKVVPDQLRISEGWVRCGQCDEVFDANVHMQTPVAPLSMASAPVSDVARPSETFAPAVEVHAAGLAEAPDTSESSGPADRTFEIQEPPSASTEDVSVAAEAMDVPVALPSDAVGRAVTTDGPLNTVQHLEQDAPPSFLRRARRRKDSPRHRWLSLLASVVLGAALVVQGLLHARDRIVAMEPAALPAMEGLCSLAGCSIQALRHIESLVIESSSFVKVKADVYRLVFTVRNTAPWPLAVPSAELTLTDLRDQSVIRKVLGPADIGVASSTLAAGEELVLTVPLSVKIPAPLGDKVSGYRLLVFYP